MKKDVKVRIPYRLRKKVDKAVKEEGFKTRAGLVRYAVRTYLERRKTTVLKSGSGDIEIKAKAGDKEETAKIGDEEKEEESEDA